MEKMKGKEVWIGVVGVLIILGAVWWSRNHRSIPTPATVSETQTSDTNQVDQRVVTDSASNLDVRNMTYMIDGTSITLIDGVAQSAIENSSAKHITAVLEGPAFADLNGDGKKDGLVILRDSAGGSGTFYYAAAVLTNGSTSKATNAVLLGDRVRIKELSIIGGVATVTILDRASGESMTTAPSVSKTLSFKVTDGVLAGVK